MSLLHPFLIHGLSSSSVPYWGSDLAYNSPHPSCGSKVTLITLCDFQTRSATLDRTNCNLYRNDSNFTSGR